MIAKVFLDPCACGCGQLIRAIDSRGRRRRYVVGHGNKQPIADRLWAKVDKSGECWLWKGAINEHGYGHMRSEGRFVRPHRVAYELLVGPVPEGLVLDHLCRTPACVNPAHLEPVTQSENLKRGIGVGGDRRPEYKGITW